MQKMEKKITSLIDDDNEWSELTIAKSCLLSIKNNENFIIGNSMPIRYIDMLGKLNNKKHIKSCKRCMIFFAKDIPHCQKSYNMGPMGP